MNDDKAGFPERGDSQVVRLANGAYSIRSAQFGETFHPVIGPAAEAEALYVRQLDSRRRFQEAGEEFVVWDVGLGAAANPIALLRSLEGLAGRVRILSFDFATEPLEVALRHTDKIDYLQGFETQLETLARTGHAAWQLFPGLHVAWDFFQGDFPTLLHCPAAADWPKPHAILYDAFSPATNTVMWTLPLFRRLYDLLDPSRPCAMPTYSRSTMLRVTLLLAGWYVGAGHATGEKEETTIAANSLELLREPLGRPWLFRARRSTSAEPLLEPVYRQAPLSDPTWEALQAHPQFRAG